jgi:hypothetical protein
MAQPQTRGCGGDLKEATMKRLLIVTAASVALCAPAVAMANQEHKADANGDGLVTRAEFDAHVAAGWTSKDKNSDGQLTLTEAGAKSGPDWTAADTDGNGTLSNAEFAAKKAGWFTRADTDADGTLSTAEWTAAKAAKPR